MYYLTNVLTCFVVTVPNYTEEANNRLILMKNEEQAFVGNSKDNDSSGMYISGCS
jgi:hypothetical protein